MGRQVIVGTCLVEFSLQGKGITQKRFDIRKNGNGWTVIFPNPITFKEGDTMTIKEYTFHAV